MSREMDEIFNALAPRQHDWKNTDSGTPVCSQCKRYPDDPFVTLCGGWKSGQCWGSDGPDFVMSIVTEGVEK